MPVCDEHEAMDGGPSTSRHAQTPVACQRPAASARPPRPVICFRACRHWWSKAVWALWPAWVWFCVMATANHYLLDVLAGILVALIAVKTVSWLSTYRKRAIVAV